MDFNLISGASMAFLAGLATSPHCVGMCGPIGCAVLPMGKGEGFGSLQWASASYHLTRALAYAVVGALAGAVGSVLVDAFSLAPARVLPWILVAVLVAIALRIDRLVPKPRWWGRAYWRLSRHLRNLPRASVGAGLGVLTPLLPCGPLYMVFALALFSGSAVFGAEIGLGFALGTIPLLWLGQSGFFAYHGRMSPVALRWTQCVLALGAAGLVTWRMLASGGEWGEMFCH